MSDATARAEAIEPHRSVIVQAPAGSGKTTLLVERYLGLLAVVEAPEEILAITFTRKAAAEMRERVLRYLDPHYTSDAPHEQTMLQRARAIADRVAQWRLLENPQRLMIRTIDSFNHFLARSMPVASALGPVPQPAPDGRALYRQAARRVLGLIEAQDESAADIERVLVWRDHRQQDVEDLLTELLAQREQWQRALSLTGAPQRHQLEAVLQALVTRELALTRAEVEHTLKREEIEAGDLISLVRGAEEALIADPAARTLSNLTGLPDADPASLPAWRALASALLTADSKGTFRKRVDKRTGFLPKTEAKDRFMDILGTLGEHEAMGRSLHRARTLPAPRYNEEEWLVLQALVRLLMRAAVELELVFARAGQTDYAGLAAAALRGLGDEEDGYTDLGLYLDSRIQHLLVDEFQDTNWGQLHLLEKLTHGWMPDDGRSLFVVGDPMQSIYRFREADVGLFIRSRAQGIGPLPLEAKQLVRNFRARAEVVEWVNNRLGPIFPKREDAAAGAVSYAPSEAGRDEGGSVESLAFPSDELEAAAIAAQARAALDANAGNPDFKAAIIVRARTHLSAILPALADAGVPYRAVKLDPLTSRGVVQDLLAITRAIRQPADTSAVLAVLRAPTCGLTLADLHAFCGDGRVHFDEDAVSRLSEDGRHRAQRALEALEGAQSQWRRRSLRELVENTWNRLGGPASCQHPDADLRDAQSFLDALEEAEDGGALDDWNNFMERLSGVQTEGDPPNDDVKLEILTMHGAKGLEWDLVFLPGLNRKPPNPRSQLLHWLPVVHEGHEQVLLAPLRQATEKEDQALVKLIRSEERARASFENQRLLYVATTRARERLVLTARIKPGDDDTPPKPAAGSLLHDLWPTCESDFLASLATTRTASAPATGTADRFDQTLRRVASTWQPPIAPASTWRPTLQQRVTPGDIEFNWAGTQARRIGTVLHRLLEHVGNIGIEQLDIDMRQHLISKIPQLLGGMGVRREDLEAPASEVRAAFEATLESSSGRWVLSGKHEQAACELPLSGIVGRDLVSAVIDRTFVADGVRWIIDYKSGYHAGADLDTFFNEEADRYRGQLHRYRKLFENLDSLPVRTALYLPRHRRLEEVDTSIEPG